MGTIGSNEQTMYVTIRNNLNGPIIVSGFITWTKNKKENAYFESEI